MMDYKFGNKAQWRRWSWNRIAERVDNPRSALVLHLAGPTDLDRAEAIRRGFVVDNLVSVERDGRALTAVRARGVNCVDGDIFGVALRWPADRPLSVVFADLCCGLHGRVVLGLAGALANPATATAVFVVNLLRGRDSDTNEWRRHIVDAGEKIPDGKHRGAFAYIGAMHGLCGCFDERGAANESLDVELGRSRFRLMSKHTAPQFYSYRSAAQQTFDTVVFNNPMGPSLGERACNDLANEHRNAMRAHMAKDAQRRSIAAALAWRTRNTSP